MTVATSIANPQPGAADPLPLATLSDKGLGRVFETSRLGTTPGFAKAFQSALAVDTSTVPAERPFSARESRTPLSRASQDFLRSNASPTPAPDARLVRVTSARSEEGRPEPARNAATKVQPEKLEASPSEPEGPNDQKTTPAARQPTSAQTESATKDQPVSSKSTPAVGDEPDTAEPAGESAAGMALVVTPVPTAPLPETHWGDIEGSRLASEETPLVNGAEEAEPAADSMANEALPPLRPVLRAVTPPNGSAPQLEGTSSGPIRSAISEESTDEEQPLALLPVEVSPPVAPEQDKSASSATAAPSAMAATPVAAIPVAVIAEPVRTATSSTSLSDRQPALDRRLTDRPDGRHAQGVDLPEAAELTTPSTKTPIAFTMQLKVAESGPETAARELASQPAPPQSVVPVTTAHADRGAGNSLSLPSAEADSSAGHQALSGPVSTPVARTTGDREPQQERHSGGETTSGQEQPSPSAQPMAVEKPSAATVVSAPTSFRVEAAGAVRSPAPERTITSTEAVANAGGTRAEQVRNLPRPVGPQRLALRVDPPPVAGTSAAPAPGRAVELYLEQRGADVHFAVRSADPSMVSDLQGSVKDLSSRLEQAGFRTESLLPTDAVRGAGQSQAANNSGPRDDESGQRQPGENSRGQSDNQSNGRDPRQSRDGQQPRWRNEFEEMFGGTATPVAASRADR